MNRGVMVLPAAPRLFRSRDTEVRYRADSELFYLTGCTEPDAVAVLTGGDEARLVLFVRDRDPEAERWSGPVLGPEAAQERSGADETFSLAQLETSLPGLLRGGDAIYYRPGRRDALDRMVLEALAHSRSKGQRMGVGPRSLIDPGEALDELRMVKDEHEIERLRSAARITAEGHRAALVTARPGKGEWVVQAEIDAVFRRNGAEGPGFDTIVGSGSNACVLHYAANGRVIEEGDLVLVDAGAEVDLYQGDMSRTFPASGRYSPEQRAVYEVVEAARARAVAAASPGGSVADVHDAAVRVLTSGLVELGVLDGTMDELIHQEAYKAFFPHQTSHWLGLDVHDPGDYATEGRSRILEPGMVLTVEPGLYFPDSAEGGAALFAGIGVRIEDEVLVTEDGAENLTGSLLPTSADDMEYGMRAWIDLHHALRGLSRDGIFTFLTDNAVGSAEEESLAHVGANLDDDADPRRIVPILTCKHALEYCTLFATRAASQGFDALTVLGGDDAVGPPRCVPRARDLRRIIRDRSPGLTLGGWVNPLKDPVEQVEYLTARDAEVEFALAQVVSHHSLAEVERFLEVLDASGSSLPVVFGVFFYRSANPATLSTLAQFFPVPAEDIAREFEAGREPEEICARSIRQLRSVGADKIYVSNLGNRRTRARLKRIMALV
jgi:Xaa-Pro aminopeptidase